MSAYRTSKRKHQKGTGIMQKGEEIHFEDYCDHLLCNFINEKLRPLFDLNPDTNEDYRQFLIKEGVLPREESAKAV